MINKILLWLQLKFLRRPTFKRWCVLEDLKFDIVQAVEDNSLTFPECLRDYLSTALYFKVNYNKVYWKDEILAFYKIHGVSSVIRKIPITSTHEKSKSDKDAWDYSGRLFYMYANLLASAYGWTQEQIAKLDVNDALAFLQEILTDRQLEKEFVWQTSEIAYPYDKSTKKSKFQPLTRPYWMVKQKETRKAAPVPKALLPMGNIIRLDQSYEKNKPKATELGGHVETIPPTQAST